MKRNRLFYAFLLFLSLSFVYFYGGRVPYMLFHITLLLPVVSLIYTLIVYLRFKFTQDVDKRFLIKGDRVNFIFSVNNEDIFLYPFISVTLCGAERLFNEQLRIKSFSIKPFGKKSFSFGLTLRYRGSYEIGIKSIDFEDFLGIFRFKYTLRDTKLITVYPRIIELDYFNLKTDYMSEIHANLRSKSEDMSSVEDIRKYAFGDSLRKIHWKLTAKTGRLLVKKYQSTSETSAVLFLDLMSNPYSHETNTIIEDKVVEAAVSVLHYCTRNWIPVRLVYYNDGLKEVEARNPLMFEELYGVLAEIKFNQSIVLEDLLDVYLKEYASKTNVILFTSNISYSLYNVIYEAKVAGFEISLVYISPREASGEEIADEDNILSSLPEIGVSTFKLNINDDIKGLLEARAVRS